MTRSVTVQTVRILNANTGGDPGNDLEIYGNLGVWVKRRGSSIGSPALAGHLFMDTDGNRPASITQNTELFVGGDKTMTVADNEELWIGGHLWEQDTNPNDDLGGHYRRFRYNDPPEGEIRIFFHDRDNDQRAEAIFTFP